MVNPLHSEKAQQLSLQLQEQFDSIGTLDGKQDSLYPLSHLFERGKGQMFGILLCEDSEGNEVILKAFSGQFLQKWSIPGWVDPPFESEKFDAIWKGSTNSISELEKRIENGDRELLKERRELSFSVQKELNALYRFHTIDKRVKTLEQIFTTSLPPSGTGECCAPKLLNEAFKRALHPISMAEFFYGDSPLKEHKQFYPPCDTRCKELLTAMLTLEILYLDRSIVVVNKEASLLSVPGRGIENQDCVVSRVKRLFRSSIEQPAVHRLDMDTSGVMVLAFDQKSHRSLSIQFIKQQVKKEYEALVEGVIKEDGGKIELAFRYDPEHKPRQVYDPVLGKWGTTVWEKKRVEYFTEKRVLVTRLLFTPITGRTHQLRLHSASPLGLNHPIVGDPLYGNPALASRMMLHATFLSFIHPDSQKRVEFRSPSPF